MPIELPNLDDRTFADLLDEGRNMIPALAPSWTDHNPSDPGITLLEMFAAVTEQLIYRTNRITNAHKNVFLRWIEPPADTGLSSDLPPSEIDDALVAAIRKMRVEKRAITAADYERLACNAGAVRARCLPRCQAVYQDDGSTVLTEDTLGHVTLVVAKLPDTLRSALNEQITALTTDAAPLGVNARPTLHIVPAQALPVTLSVTLVCLEEYRANNGKMVRDEVSARLEAYFHIETGGPAKQGWPLGKAVYKSTLYALISQIKGVDYITALRLSCKLLRTDDNGVTPASHEYIQMKVLCHFSNEQGQ